MIVLANTTTLVEDQILSRDIAREIEIRGRAALVRAAINTLLCFGILAATGGLIFFLADPVAVAVLGCALLGLGVWILRGSEMFHMFGNAAALIGAGMLIGGAGLELVNSHPDRAGLIMTLAGLALAAASGLLLLRGARTFRFAAGAVFLMAAALHLAGFAQILEHGEITGLARPAFFLYAAISLALSGWLTDIRLVTALAIVPLRKSLIPARGISARCTPSGRRNRRSRSCKCPPLWRPLSGPCPG